MKRDFGKKKEEAHWSYCVKGAVVAQCIGEGVLGER